MDRRLQWGHGDEAVEETDRMCSIACGGMRFNGATAMKPWKSGILAISSRQSQRFNGATAMKPWKRARPPDLSEQRT